MIIEINFLPWRKQKKRKQLITLLFITLTIFLINLLLVLIILKIGNGLLERQKQKNQLLQINIATLSRQDNLYRHLEEQKSEMLKAIQQKQENQKQNNTWINLLTLLRHQLNNEFFIQQIVYKKQSLKIIGTTQRSTLSIQHFKEILIKANFLEQLQFHVKIQPPKTYLNSPLLTFVIQGKLKRWPYNQNLGLAPEPKN